MFKGRTLGMHLNTQYPQMTVHHQLHIFILNFLINLHVPSLGYLHEHLDPREVEQHHYVHVDLQE